MVLGSRNCSQSSKFRIVVIRVVITKTRRISLKKKKTTETSRYFRKCGRAGVDGH